MIIYCNQNYDVVKKIFTSNGIRFWLIKTFPSEEPTTNEWILKINVTECILLSAVHSDENLIKGN